MPINGKRNVSPRVTEHIKYCPNCRGDIRRIKSKNKPSGSSSKFRCDTCRREFEIGDLIPDC